MLPKIHRLKKNSDIEAVIKGGRGSYEGSIHIMYKRSALPMSRFAFVAGKKNISMASGRNEIKRYMREGIRGELFNISPGYDVVCLFSGKEIPRDGGLGCLGKW